MSGWWKKENEVFRVLFHVGVGAGVEGNNWAIDTILASVRVQDGRDGVDMICGLKRSAILDDLE